MCLYFNKQVVTCIDTNYRSTVISLMTFVRQFVANFTEPCSHPVPHARSVITNDLYCFTIFFLQNFTKKVYNLLQFYNFFMMFYNFTEPCSYPVPNARSVITKDL